MCAFFARNINRTRKITTILSLHFSPTSCVPASRPFAQTIFSSPILSNSSTRPVSDQKKHKKLLKRKPKKKPKKKTQLQMTCSKTTTPTNVVLGIGHLHSTVELKIRLEFFFNSLHCSHHHFEPKLESSVERNIIFFIRIQTEK